MKNEEKIPAYLIENMDVLKKIYEDVKIVGVRVRSSDNRLQCSIKWKDGSKVSTAARLMLEIKMERRLDVDETVDHNNGDSHPTSKLTNSQVLEIKESQKNYLIGSGQDKELAIKYGVCRSTIKGIRLGYSRKLR